MVADKESDHYKRVVWNVEFIKSPESEIQREKSEEKSSE